MEKELREAYQRTKNDLTSALLESALKYGSQKDQALDPFMYAGCIVAAAVSAWVRMMIAIKTTIGESVEPEKIEPMLRGLLDAAITGSMGSIDFIQEELKTK